MGIAVCATSTDAALKGKDALKVQWDKGALPDMDNAYIEKLMMADLGARIRRIPLTPERVLAAIKEKKA